MMRLFPYQCGRLGWRLNSPRAATRIALSGLGLLVGLVTAVQAQVTPAAPGPSPTPGQVTIESDLQRADNRTGVITATGNVRIVYPEQRVVATARQAQYFSKEGRVVLTGDVDVVQTDGHSLRAERVIYDLNSQRLVAEPPSHEQVFSKVLLPPSKNAPVTGSQPNTSQPNSHKSISPQSSGLNSTGAQSSRAQPTSNSSRSQDPSAAP
jgi:lipopolysaccharide export system protein LptA